MDRSDTEPEPMETEDSNQNIPHSNNLDAEEKRQRRRKLRQNKEEQKENIVTSGKLLIIAFKNLLRDKKARKDVMCHYMERVLHSIFFFGYINCPSISPDEFLPEQEMERFKRIFPKPFSDYNTLLPCYTPFSIVLEYMVESLKLKDPILIFKELENFNDMLLKYDDEEGKEPITNDFAASVVTYSYVKSEEGHVLQKAYGASMSCKGQILKKIMIAISALYVWDRAISYAVCYAGHIPPITFPEGVHCISYKVRDKRKIPPCTKCFKMYAVEFNPEHQALNKKEDWPYGNCAENESLSRLLQSHTDMRNQICIRGDNCVNPMNREDIENKFKEHEDELQKKVRQLLASRKFNPGEWNFFIPSFMIERSS